MRLRFSLVTEHILEASLNHDCVTLSRDWFATWQADDLVCLIVDGGVAALGTAVGEPRETPIELLDRGLHPFYMSVTYGQRFPKGRRPSVSGRLWKILEEAWGETTDWAFGHLGLLEEQAASDVVGLLERHSTERADSVRATAAAASAARSEATPPATAAAGDLADSTESVPDLVTPQPPVPLRSTPTSDEGDSSRSETESVLAKLAAITGCEQRQPSPDASSPDSSDSNNGALDNVDAIWVQGDEDIAAFTFFGDEPVEIGLLRIADSLVTTKELATPLYVVANTNSAAEIQAALSRPVFQSLNLATRICVITRDAIQGLVARTEDLAGHLAPSVLETITARHTEAA